jgi:hypothetical protein
LTFAGKPAQVGGLIARSVGWLVLAIGLPSSLIAFGVLQVLFPQGNAAWLISIPLMLLTLSVWAVTYFGGKNLGKSGDRVATQTREQAILALARTRGGALRVDDVAVALRLHPSDAEGALTDLAKSLPNELTVDIDPEGRLVYRLMDLSRVSSMNFAQTPSPSNQRAPETRAVGAGPEWQTSGFAGTNPAQVKQRVPAEGRRVATPEVRVAEPQAPVLEEEPTNELANAFESFVAKRKR